MWVMQIILFDLLDLLHFRKGGGYTMVDCHGVSLAIQFGSLIMNLIFGLIGIMIASIKVFGRKK